LSFFFLCSALDSPAFALLVQYGRCHVKKDGGLFFCYSANAAEEFVEQEKKFVMQQMRKNHP
jgi:hypothetical protein